MGTLLSPSLHQPLHRPVARKPNRGPVEGLSKTNQPDNKFPASQKASPDEILANAYMIM